MLNPRPATALMLAALLAAAVGPALAADRETEARLQSLESRMERIDRILGNEALLEMQRQITDLQEQLRRLRGENEELSHNLEQLRQRQRELYLDIDRRLQPLEAGGAPASVPAAPTAPTPPAAAPAPAAPAAQPGVVPAEEQAAYKQAFNLLRDGRYEAAIAAFGDFLKRYPDSGYAGNAQYWLGEAHYVSKDYSAALAEFGKVLSAYPDSPKVADARLKLGFTYYELGEWEKARATLSEVVQKHPGTTVARLAEQRLKRMQREGH